MACNNIFAKDDTETNNNVHTVYNKFKSNWIRPINQDKENNNNIVFSFRCCYRHIFCWTLKIIFKRIYTHLNSYYDAYLFGAKNN